jgi:serpin B
MTIAVLLAALALGGCPLPSCGESEKKQESDAGDGEPDAVSTDTTERDVGIADDFEVARSSLERATPDVPDETLRQLARDNADFALSLFDEISEPGENVFYSPYSISIALAMTYAGANGNTETQMANALQFDLPEDQLHPAFNALDRALQTRGQDVPEDEEGDPFQLEIANSIWGQRDFSFEQPFLDTLASQYGAGMRLLDFMSDPEQARQIINAWVELKTRERIKDLIPEGIITAMTRLVLTNAIYFKASWKSKFEESATTTGDFRRLDGSTVQAELMHQEARHDLSYASGEGWAAAELPYVGEDVSMVVLLPDEGQFDAVQQQLSGEMIISVFDDLEPAAVDITLPKFEFESEFNLNDALKALGMTDAFDASADFSGITTAAQLFIQAVVHKAFVSVDEEGTEAAAATAVIIGETSAPEFVEFRVNRPFFFFIRDRQTNAIVFGGRMMDPTK